MSELLVLLVLTIGELLGAGAPPADLASDLQTALTENLPVACEKLTVAVTLENETTLDSDNGGYCVEFRFDNVFLEPMLIEELTITVHELSIDQYGSLSISVLEFAGRISEDALSSGLRTHADLLDKAQVLVEIGGITLHGDYHTWLATVPFSVSGTISVENQTQLMFSIDESQMIGMSIPAGINNIIEHEVNPVYDLAAFAERSKKDIKLVYEKLNYRFMLNVKEIIPRDGHIIISGEA